LSINYLRIKKKNREIIKEWIKDGRVKLKIVNKNASEIRKISLKKGV